VFPQSIGRAFDLLSIQDQAPLAWMETKGQVDRITNVKPYLINGFVLFASSAEGILGDTKKRWYKSSRKEVL
jgi:hypothetical protein